MATVTHGGEEIDRSVNSTNFTEFTLKKKATGKTVLARLGILAIFAVIIVICCLIPEIAIAIGSLGLLLALISFFFLWPLTKIEYEYITTSGDWIFTKIIGGKRRKEVLKVKIKDMDIIAPYTSEYAEKQKADKTYEFRPRIFILQPLMKKAKRQ